MKGYLLAGTAGTLWGLLSLFGKLLVRYDVDPNAMVAVRAAVAFVTLGAVLLIFRRQSLRIGWRDLPFFAVFGLLCVAGAFSNYIFALKYTTVTTAIIICYTYPALVSVLAVVFLGEQLRWTKILALGLALAGSFLVVEGFKAGAFKVNLIGILFSLGTSVSLALYSLLSKRAVVRYGPWTLGLYGFGFGALWLFAIASPRTVLSMHLPAEGWAILLAWAWVPTVLGYGVYLLALKYIEASRAAIICTLEPVSAIALAFLFLGETVSAPQLMGAALVLAGVIAVASTPSTPPPSIERFASNSDGYINTKEGKTERGYSHVNG